MIAGASAENNENNDGAKNKAKRAYTLGYGYSAPITYDHDFISHAPITYHAPLAPAITHPVIPAAIHAPIVHAPIAKASIVSTSVHHLPTASYIAPAHAPILTPAAAAYVAHHPLYTEFHRR